MGNYQSAETCQNTLDCKTYPIFLGSLLSTEVVSQNLLKTFFTPVFCQCKAFCNQTLTNVLITFRMGKSNKILNN